MLNLLDTNWQDLWGDVHRVEPQGAVYTKPEIVQLILDLVGYSTSKDERLASKRVLEPSCGDGAFIIEVVARLVACERNRKSSCWNDPILDDALRAADISEAAVASARTRISAYLTEAGCPPERANQLVEMWVVHTDFLLCEWSGNFDVVVGNPPYVRIEDLPKRVLQCYRDTFESMTDRADLYIPFMERGLSCLSERGALAFICANRWTKNQYGRILRRLVADRFHVQLYLNLEHTQPFLSEVSAYPAIFVIDRNRGKPTRAATLSDLGPETLQAVLRDSELKQQDAKLLSTFASWYPDGGSWTTTCDQEHERLARLRRFPTLENSAPGTRVGIGVATGADRVFVLPRKHPEIEEDRQIPLLMASDVTNQEIEWSGKYLLNPFAPEDDGSLVDLVRYPGLKSYLERHEEQLRGRHVAKGKADRWYRTIDRIWPELMARPKLLIPDIQGSTTIGLDPGEYYPHHNLYFITSNTWNLKALKALLRSTIVYDQVKAHSVQMRGGSLRFQAQTLRRIRIPNIASLNTGLIERLAAVSASRDQAEIDVVANEAFR